MAKTLKDIKASGSKLDALIHQAALSAVRIADKEEGTGNVFYVNQLYGVMPKGARHAALTAWLITFGGMQANEGANRESTPFVHDTNKALDLDGGQAMPWYTMKKSPEPDQVLDVLKLTMLVLKRAKAPKKGQEVAHGDMIGGLEALVKEFAPEPEEEEEEEV